MNSFSVAAIFCVFCFCFRPTDVQNQELSAQKVETVATMSLEPMAIKIEPTVSMPAKEALVVPVIEVNAQEKELESDGFYTGIDQDGFLMISSLL